MSMHSFEADALEARKAVLYRIWREARAAGECERRWYWLSFARESEGFLGGCYIEADWIPGHEHVSTWAAVRESQELGLNPGGQAMCIAFEDEEEPPPGHPRYSLLSKADLIGITGFVNPAGEDLTDEVAKAE